jgi:RsiW-degrading membrane proteinase PrsW (M82 family)
LTFPVFLSTIIPLLFLIGLLKKENRMLILFFCWGLVSFLIAFYVNTAIARKPGLNTYNMSVSIAPVVEEFFKFLPLIIFLFWKKTDSKFTLIYYGMAIGIGFSIQENYLYLQHYSLFNKQAILTLVILRGVSTSLMHGLTTAIAAFGLCVIKDFKFFTFHLTFGLISFAILSHSLFNLYINSPLKIIGIIMPLVIYIFAIVAFHSIEENS